MFLVKPSIEFLNMTERPLEAIERAGRTCYKSEAKIGVITCDVCKGTGKNAYPYTATESCKICDGKGTVSTSSLFVRQLLRNGHFAMIEHAWASYRVVTDRGVTHEIVRHRLFSYAQESTRYCNYKGGVTFIIPPWMAILPGEYGTAWPHNSPGVVISPVDHSLNNQDDTWLAAVACSELRYQYLVETGWEPQQARGVLPNALKTEIVITGNLREWRHFFTLRTAPTAHPQMREVADMLLKDIRGRVPVLFSKL